MASVADPTGVLSRLLEVGLGLWGARPQRNQASPHFEPLLALIRDVARLRGPDQQLQLLQHWQRDGSLRLAANITSRAGTIVGSRSTQQAKLQHLEGVLKKKCTSEAHWRQQRMRYLELYDPKPQPENAKRWLTHESATSAIGCLKVDSVLA